MGNTISHKTKEKVFHVSNSWTSVLYGTLMISGSETAKTEWEKLFMIWLAEHDQNVVGPGIVGIDFDDVCWREDDFKSQQDFVVNLAARAIEENLWYRLDYLTDEKVLIALFNDWIDLFQEAKKEDIKPKKDFRWYSKPQSDDLDKRCSIHGIYLNRLGETEAGCCMLCNDV